MLSRGGEDMGTRSPNKRQRQGGGERKGTRKARAYQSARILETGTGALGQIQHHGLAVARLHGDGAGGLLAGLDDGRGGGGGDEGGGHEAQEREGVHFFLVALGSGIAIDDGVGSGLCVDRGLDDGWFA